MSIYVNTDDDGLFKKKVQRLCICCLSRFQQYKIAIKDLKDFDALANHYQQHTGRKYCSNDIAIPEDNGCGLCNEFTSVLNLTGNPFKCRICSKVFSHPLHLQEHKLCHEEEGGQKGGTTAYMNGKTLGTKVH